MTSSPLLWTGTAIAGLGFFILAITNLSATTIFPATERLVPIGITLLFTGIAIAGLGTYLTLKTK